MEAISETKFPYVSFSRTLTSEMIMRFYKIMFSNVLTNVRERIDWGKDVVCIKDSLGLKDNVAGSLFHKESRRISN